MTISQTETTAIKTSEEQLSMPTPEDLRRHVDYTTSVNSEIAKRRREALNSEILASIHEQLTSMDSWDGKTIHLRVTLKEPNPRIEDIDITAKLPGWTVDFSFRIQPSQEGYDSDQPYVLAVSLGPIWASETVED